MDRINDKLEELYNFWFSNSDIWFNINHKIDEIIYNKYAECYLKYEIEENMEEIIKDRKMGISVILLCDQIIRHIVRYDKNLIIFEIPREDILEEYNKKAIEISKIIYKRYDEEITDEEYCFVMLPYRHNGSYRNIKYVLEETWKKIENGSSEIIRRFLNATYNRYLIKNDDEENIKIYDRYEREYNKSKYDRVLDKRCLEFKINNGYDIDEIKEEFKDKLKYEKENKIILSISGGVDSMICSYILRKLEIDFVCVHINYNNRKESELEEEFIIDWCSYINIPLYIRKIEEINRPKSMKYGFRNLYEDYTRNIRYNTYKQVSRMIKNNKCYVILGHNKDDCFENILTNITNKNKYENLFGMENITIIDNIIFMRPMLNINKSEIYEIANNLDINYLCDSTPEWSQRGKIRDKVRPVLEEWNNKSIEGFFELKKIMEDSNKLIEELIEVISSNIEIVDKNIRIKFNRGKIIINRIFWEKILKKYNIKYSVRGIDGYIERIKNISDNYDKIHINHINSYQMNKNYIVNITKRKDNILEILFNFI